MRPSFNYPNRQAAQQQSQKKSSGQQMSAQVRIYYASRWINFYLSFIGILFIFIGILYAEGFNVIGDTTIGFEWLAWILGGALISGLTIYSNKRR